MYNQTIVNVTNICVSYSLNDSSGLVFNFSYTFPNNTNLNSMDYQLGYYEGCRISSIPLSADIIFIIGNRSNSMIVGGHISIVPQEQVRVVTGPTGTFIPLILATTAASPKPTSIR
jgi:hypothetical protein